MSNKKPHGVATRIRNIPTKFKSNNEKVDCSIENGVFSLNNSQAHIEIVDFNIKVSGAENWQSSFKYLRNTITFEERGEFFVVRLFWTDVIGEILKSVVLIPVFVGETKSFFIKNSKKEDVAYLRWRDDEAVISYWGEAKELSLILCSVVINDLARKT